MTNRQNYQTLLDEYEKRVQLIKKLGLAGGIMQFSIILVVNSLKHLEIPYYKFIGPLLLLWAIYSFIKDFLVFLRIEKDVALMIKQGVEMEKRNASFGRSFHEILEDFNLVKVLSIRSSINLLTFGCFGYFLSKCMAELNPAFTINYSLLIFISIGLTTLACKSYYNALITLSETKAQVFDVKSQT